MTKILAALQFRELFSCTSKVIKKKSAPRLRFTTKIVSELLVNIETIHCLAFQVSKKDHND